MSLPKITIVVGTLLLIQGVGFYLGTSAVSKTALIPAFVGLPILLLGIVALKESIRMHAMHLAGGVGLLGFVAAIGRMISAGVSTSPAGISVLLMALLSGGFLILCIKSFRDARRRRREAEQG